LAPYRALASELGVRAYWHVGYQPLSAFVAAVAAADVVLCPYERASQSGILAVAAATGTPTVATDVGGLSELADAVAAPGDVASLASAVRSAAASKHSSMKPRQMAGSAVYRMAYSEEGFSSETPRAHER
jgi:glycosyltransferase involved in cell wall biosynthesis